MGERCRPIGRVPATPEEALLPAEGGNAVRLGVAGVEGQRRLEQCQAGGAAILGEAVGLL